MEAKVNAANIRDDPVLDTLESRISSWHRMKRVLVWVLRFASKEWRKTKREEITVAEIQQAETRIIRLMQAREYKTEIEQLQA